MLVIVFQTNLERGFVIVFALNQFRTATVANAFLLRLHILNVIGSAAFGANATSADATNEFAVFDHNVDDHGNLSVNFRAHLFQSFCLNQRARETVEKIAIGTVRARKSLADQADRDVIRNQVSTFDDGFRLQSERSALGDGFTEHIASGDMRDVESVNNTGRLGAFPGSRRAHEDDIQHAYMPP